MGINICLFILRVIERERDTPKIKMEAKYRDTHTIKSIAECEHDIVSGVLVPAILGSRPRAHVYVYVCVCECGPLYAGVWCRCMYVAHMCFRTVVWLCICTDDTEIAVCRRVCACVQ